MNQCTSNHQATLHATGKGSRWHMALIPEAQLTQILSQRARQLFTGNTKVTGLVNQDIDRLFKLIKIKFLRHHAHMLFGLGKVLIYIAWPKILTLPLVFRTSEQIMPIVVDLPAPLGPSRAKKSPGATLRSIPLRASKLIVVGLAELLYGQCWLCGIVQLMLSILVMVTRKYIVALSTQDVWF